MLKIYMRLLGFARPIQKYAIPYFFYSLLYALFNSLTFLLIMPILKTMFDADYTFVYVEKLPPLAFNQEYLTALFNYTYSHLFNEYNPENVLLMLAVVTIFVSLLSNLFRYLGSWTVENMRTRTLQRMRNEMFSKVVDMHVGFFSDQRKGDIISKITSDVGVVQFCITNTLQVAFREPFLIIGYTVMMVAISWELALFSVLFLPVWPSSSAASSNACATRPARASSAWASWYRRSTSPFRASRSSRATTPWIISSRSSTT